MKRKPFQLQLVTNPIIISSTGSDLPFQHDARRQDAASFHLSCDDSFHHFRYGVVCCGDDSCILCPLLCCCCSLSGFSYLIQIRCPLLLGLLESWELSQTPRDGLHHRHLQGQRLSWDESYVAVAYGVLSCCGGGCRAFRESKRWRR